MIRVGSRGSPLALAQAEWVAQQLTSAGQTVTIKKITTQGDKFLDVPLAKVGGKGLFVKEIEEELLSGEIDLAVHSMKDMPAQSLEGLTIGAVPKREDPRDALISQGGLPLSQIASGGKIGTSSLRRQAHFKKIRPDLVFIPLRGNLHTRLRKLAEGEVNAVILAAAGLHRLGLKDRITEYIPFSISLPAVGQGALAIECRADDKRIKETIAFLNDLDTAIETCAERAMLARLAGGCQVPIAGWAKRTGGLLQLEGLVSNLEGTIVIRETKTAPVEEAYRLGVAVAESLLAQGADQILDALMAQG